MESIIGLICLGSLFIIGYFIYAFRKIHTVDRRLGGLEDQVEELERKISEMGASERGGEEEGIEEERSAPAADAGVEREPAGEAADRPFDTQDVETPGETGEPEEVPEPQVAGRDVGEEGIEREEELEDRTPSVSESTVEEGKTPPSGSAPEKPEEADTPFPSVNWEELLGKRVLVWVGGVLLIVGILFFIDYAFQRMTPAQRLATVSGAGGLLVFISLYLEYDNRFERFVKPVGSLGWAILYIAALGSHAFEGIRVFETAAPSYISLLVVSGGMIGHAIFYRSELLTVASYFFTYGSVLCYLELLGASPSVTFLPSAFTIVVLSLSVSWISSYFSWDRLTITGTVFSHLFLLYLGVLDVNPVFSVPVFGEVRGLVLLLVLLSLTWVLFQVPSYASRDENPLQLGYLLINSVAYASVFSFVLSQVDPDALRYFLFVFALVQTGQVGFEIRTGRRDNYNMYVFFASALVYLGTLRSTDGYRLALLWLLEGQVLFLLLRLTGHQIYRELSTLGLAVSLYPLFYEDLHRRTTVEVFGRTIPGGWYLYWLLAALGYGNGTWLSRWSDLFENLDFSVVSRGYFWAGAVFLWTAVFLTIAVPQIPLAWGIVGVLLFELGFEFKQRDLFQQFSIFLFSGFVYVYFVDFGQEVETGFLAIRAGTFGLLTAMAGYVYERLYHMRKKEWVRTFYHPEAYLTAAIFIAVSIVWFEVPRAYRTVGWALIACALYPGFRLRPDSFRYEASAVALLAVLDGVALSFIENTQFYGVEHRWVSIVIAALFFLVIGFVQLKPEEHSGSDMQHRIRYYLFPAGGFALLTALFYGEFTDQFITVSWAAVGLLLLVPGMILRKRNIRYPALWVLMMAVGRIVIVDLERLELVYRIFSFVGLGAILITASYAYFYFERVLEEQAETPGETE